MDEHQRTVIKVSYAAGATEQEIADTLGISAEEVDVYLSWWCDRGCPGMLTED